MGAVLGGREADTRLRLIEAASALFIDQGYAATRIRDIVRRAQTNIAAVNYHFGGKDGLYAAVIQHHAAEALADIAQSTTPGGDTPETRLRGYVRVFLKRLLHDNVQSRMAKLIARETVAPTAAFDLVVEQFIVPGHSALNRIVRAILGASASEEHVRRAGMSVIGQCLYYQNARRVVSRLDPDFHYSIDDVARLADHIAAFSLGGLRELGAGSPGAAKPSIAKGAR